MEKTDDVTCGESEAFVHRFVLATVAFAEQVFRWVSAAADLLEGLVIGRTVDDPVLDIIMALLLHRTNAVSNSGCGIFANGDDGDFHELDRVSLFWGVCLKFVLL